MGNKKETHYFCDLRYDPSKKDFRFSQSSLEGQKGHQPSFKVSFFKSIILEPGAFCILFHVIFMRFLFKFNLIRFTFQSWMVYMLSTIVSETLRDVLNRTRCTVELPLTSLSGRTSSICLIIQHWT